MMEGEKVCAPRSKILAFELGSTCQESCLAVIIPRSTKPENSQFSRHDDDTDKKPLFSLLS
jgi:hypothetical protein